MSTRAAQAPRPAPSSAPVERTCAPVVCALPVPRSGVHATPNITAPVIVTLICPLRWLRGGIGFFRFDDLDAGLPQLLSAAAVDRRGGQDDARRDHAGSLLVQAALAFQPGQNRGPDAGGDLDENVLMIMDQDIETVRRRWRAARR